MEGHSSAATGTRWAGDRAVRRGRILIAGTGLSQAIEHGIHVELSSTLADIAAHRLTVRPVGRVPMMYVEPVQRTGWRPRAKRARGGTASLRSSAAKSAGRPDAPRRTYGASRRSSRSSIASKEKEAAWSHDES